jgi:hypothetical protein
VILLSQLSMPESYGYRGNKIASGSPSIGREMIAKEMVIAAESSLLASTEEVLFLYFSVYSWT